MNDHYRNLISGQPAGPIAGLERAVLRAAESIYRFNVDRRNHSYDRDPSKSISLSVPVISIGNITVGGTGKTPLTMCLAQRLLDQARRPAVISRGYKAADGVLNEEMRLIQRRVPGVVCLSDPDRVAAGRRAIDEHGADVLLMDDGFQHRRLRRDVDIVLIDALNPFGYGHVLPRGLLREPMDGLRRADLIVITRADQAETGSVEKIRSDLRSRFPQLPVASCSHRPVGFVDLAGQPIKVSADQLQRVVLFAGIGRPGAFEMTAREFGAHPVGRFWWPDHHHYGPTDVKTLMDLVRKNEASFLLTTEKDAVKLADMKVDWPAPVGALRIEIAFDDADREAFFQPIDRLVGAAASR